MIEKTVLFAYTNNILTNIYRGKGQTMGIRKFDVELGHIHPDTAKLLSITSSKYEEDWISVPHTHYYTEIFYIKSGKGHMLIENDLIPLHPDSLVIINAQVEHTEISTPREPLDYYVVGVEDLQIVNESNSEYTIIENADRHLKIRHCFECILEETNEKQEYYRDLCQNYLEILIRKIQRNQPVSLTSPAQQNGTHECHKAKQYMDTNYAKKITLDTLAKVSNINKYYLSHCFSEIYGQSPIAYLNQVRVNVCKDLLINTNLTIEDIAASTGFSSRSYLAQVFQKKYGMTCQQYRKIYRKQ